MIVFSPYSISCEGELNPKVVEELCAGVHFDGFSENTFWIGDSNPRPGMGALDEALEILKARQEAFRKAGVTHIHLMISAHYLEQCALGFQGAELVALGRCVDGVALDCYKVEKTPELRELAAQLGIEIEPEGLHLLSPEKLPAALDQAHEKGPG